MKAKQRPTPESFEVGSVRAHRPTTVPEGLCAGRIPADCAAGLALGFRVMLGWESYSSAPCLQVHNTYIGPAIHVTRIWLLGALGLVLGTLEMCRGCEGMINGFG